MNYINGKEVDNDQWFAQIKQIAESNEAQKVDMKMKVFKDRYANALKPIEKKAAEVK